MIRYFLSRLVKHQAYRIKWLTLLFLGAFLLYGAWTDTVSFLEDFEWSYYQVYVSDQEELAFYERAYEQARAEAGELDDYEELAFQQNLTTFQSGVASYEAFQRGDYAASVGHDLNKIRVTFEGYEIGNGVIPPGGDYFVSTVKQYGHFVDLKEAYYQELLKQPEEISKEESLSVSALDLFLQLAGYWKAKEADWFQLNTYLFLVPLLFSIGVITRDRQVISLYRSMGYSSRSYVRDLFIANLLHAFLSQMLILLAMFLPLAYRFGWGNALVNLAFIWDGQPVVVPFLGGLAVYAGLVLVLDGVLILLSMLVELLFEELAAIAATTLVLLAGLRLAFLRESYPGKTYNPFYYFDVFRSINGWINLTRQGLKLSLDRFLVGASLVCGGLVLVLVLILMVKERRGRYV